ncbi:sugar transferase [Anabaena sp. UHCC 0187]|nr:sugar transferase [Anabaena sp. UHCC 0187]
MSMSVISNPNNNYIIPQQSENISCLSCTLQWRMGKLLVKSSGKLPQLYLASLENKESLIECLKHSSVSLVSIDPKIGDSLLKVWADACLQANKPIFVSIPRHHKFPKKGHQIFRVLSRIIDWTLALFLLLFMSPFVLAGFIIMRIYSPRFLLDYEWYIGENCQLFRVIKFSSTTSGSLRDSHISLSKYCLENFCKLLNVLQGRNCLIGKCSLSLEDATKLSLEKQDKKLNQQPKFIKSLQMISKNKIPTA